MSGILGLDIGTGSIKSVYIDKIENKLIVDSIGEIKTPALDWISGADKNKAIDEISKSIKIMISDMKVKTKQVVISLPEHEVICRLIKLPALKESEIRDALRYEAETFVPYPLDQVSIDYEIVSTEEGGKLSLFVIAARNDLIQTYIKIAKSSGLELVALETPATALKRVMDVSVNTSAGTIIVDLGEKYTNLVSVMNGNVYMTRSIAVGGEAITRSISMGLNLDMPSAEEYKKAYGIKENELEGKIRATILPIYSTISEEIRKAIALFSENHSAVVSSLVLTGGGANLPGFAEEITKLLGIEVQVINPFLKLDTTKVSQKLDVNVCKFSIASGLSLRGIL